MHDYRALEKVDKKQLNRKRFKIFQTTLCFGAFLPFLSLNNITKLAFECNLFQCPIAFEVAVSLFQFNTKEINVMKKESLRMIETLFKIVSLNMDQARVLMDSFFPHHLVNHLYAMLIRGCEIAKEEEKEPYEENATEIFKAKRMAFLPSGS